ncbi:MAG: hypothetical protein JWM37_747 [Candidatus Saccharibacteria bacterium]|nr:hypothetical protein [Candidatus Saccharibacteria bacterium]
MFRQRLLLMWANYRLHHILRLAAEVSLGVFIVTGAVTTVVTVTPIRHNPTPVVASPTSVAPAPATKPTAKKPTPPPAPAPVATPAVTAPAPKPVAPQPSPTPVAPTQPSPGSGAKKLVPTPAAAPAPAPATPDQSAASQNDSNTASSTPALVTSGYYSSNWAGYAAMTGKFTAVSGSWIVPTVTGNGSETTGDAAWIGIGGVSTDDLIQTGTFNMVDPDGTVTVSAFYELLPAPAMALTSFNVKAGDTMAASISELPSHKWNITITNTTSGQTYATVVDYASSYSSAEWIEEDPSYLDGSLVPFNDFDHVKFTNGSTTRNGVVSTIAGSNADPITLVDSSNRPLVTPTVLLGSGTGFWAVHN